MKLTFRTACSTLTELIAARTAELRRAEPELARLLDRSEVQEGRPVRTLHLAQVLRDALANANLLPAVATT